jgi:hypothetical protein
MKTMFPILTIIGTVAISTASEADYSVVERGPHHRVWAKVTWQTDASGRITARTNSYTELTSGMHYQDPKSGQ